MQACISKYENFEPLDGGLYCAAGFDTYLCWPPTAASSFASQKCPAVPFSDTSKTVYKRCGEVGQWEGKEGAAKDSGNETVGGSMVMGWTNYTPCITAESQILLTNLRGDAGRMKLDIAANTRKLEMCGLSISLGALLVSLAIFGGFRSLRNNRTRIHNNLFVAMLVQVLIRLIVYVDQAVWRHSKGDRGIDNTQYLCEASYVLMEFAKTVMFMWMFIEGFYLHNIVTVTVFQERQHYGLYYAFGWGIPVLLTIVWVVANTLYFRGQAAKCWWGYNLSYSYWILEGPRLFVMLVNFVFLMNIIRVLVMKLRQSHTSDIEMVRKAVRAAIVLLPLLGISNLLNMTNPLDKSALEFALWSYTTHFLSSFQGFFVALLYCFLNGEVRIAIKKKVALFFDMREQRIQHRRSSAFHFVSSEANVPQGQPLGYTRGTNCWNCSKGNDNDRENDKSEGTPLPETRV